MKIKILDPNSIEVFAIQFPLLDINISRGRKVLIRSTANKYGLLAGTSIRKDANGVGYMEVKMKPNTSHNKVIEFTNQIVKGLLIK